MSFLTDALTGVTAAVGAEYMTLIIIVLTLILFAMDKLPMGFVAMLSAIVLGITGCMSLNKIYSGWSSSLVIMLIGMMIVGDAMFQTGAVLMIGRNIMRSKFAKNERAVMAIIMLLSGVLSAFLSNTAVVATFIPLIGAMVASSGGTLKQKHLMMPLGFAAAMGGTLTVIGSTSQPMVNTVLEGQGLELMPIFSIFPVAAPREPLNKSLYPVSTQCISRHLRLVKVISVQNSHYLSA
ncbi:SLC13 family permease, partial [Intestinimonas sp. HCP28S3_D6]|uniref:SLC13 family permease n=1 Tax=Intestinimonas sp. HCP28S3_D6 TaxID=3438942 RepID=UPI003F8CD344